MTPHPPLPLPPLKILRKIIQFGEQIACKYNLLFYCDVKLVVEI